MVVNPIAGMGGAVGLKGSDGKNILKEAKRRGASPVSPSKVIRALRNIDFDGVEVISAPGSMGADILETLGVKHSVIEMDPVCSRDDTLNAVKKMEALDLLIFAGGDGTARDILDATGGRVPVIGIPAGVKMHSAVFASSPESAGKLIQEFILGNVNIAEAEVLDTDEEAFRDNRLDVRLYGVMPSIKDRLMMPGSKGPSAVWEEDEKKEIGQYVAETMDKDVIYLIGPGTTAKACLRWLGLKASILGVDAVKNEKLIGADLSESEILDIVGNRDARIVVGVVGGQGFILGRGNQQLSARVLRSIGIQSLMVLCTPSKLHTLNVLRVDTGDPSLDAQLRGYTRVIVGYGKERVVRVV